MEPLEEDVWTKPAASFRIKKTGGSRGRASFSQVVAGKRRNPFLQGVADSETEVGDGVVNRKLPRSVSVNTWNWSGVLALGDGLELITWPFSGASSPGIGEG